jgi:hypothetical protein
MGWVFRFAPVIDRLEIDAPKLRLTRLGDGRYDVDDILAQDRRSAEAPGDAGRRGRRCTTSSSRTARSTSSTCRPA